MYNGDFDIRVSPEEEAVRRMKRLKLSSDVIKNFEDNFHVQISEYGKICELNDIERGVIRRFEKKEKAVVFHVIREKQEDKVYYYFLFVCEDKKKWYLEDVLLSKNFLISCFLYSSHFDVDYLGITVESNNGVLRRKV